MQDLVFIGNRTSVCACSTDSSHFSFGRSELERHDFSVRQAMDTYCRQGITHVVQQVEATGSCTFKTLALDAAAAYLASRCLQSDRHELHREVKHDLQVMQGLVFTPVDHFPHSLHVACPFAFHELLDTTCLEPRFFGNAQWACRLFLRILDLGFRPSPNGLGDTPGVASVPLLCLWLACFLNPAKDLRRPDLLSPVINAINAGIHVDCLLGERCTDVQHVVSSTGDSYHLAFHDGLFSYSTYKHGAAGSHWLVYFPHDRTLQALTFSLH